MAQAICSGDSGLSGATVNRAVERSHTGLAAASAAALSAAAFSAAALAAVSSLRGLVRRGGSGLRFGGSELLARGLRGGQ